MGRVSTQVDDVVLERGFEVVSDTSAHTAPLGKPFVCIQSVTATVIATLATDALSPVTGNAITTLTLPPNALVYGRFTSVTLTSGTCIAYKGV